MDAFHQRRRSYDAPATRAISMPIAMQSAVPVGESPFGRHAQPYSPLLRQSPYLLTRTPLSASLPGTYTIKEEGSYSLDTPAFVEHTRQTLQSMLRPQAAFAANSPPRRQSNTSFGGSSVRSYSDETAPTVAMLAHDREANMRTPRPHTALAVASNAMTAEPQSQYGDGTEGRIMQWQQRRDASDNTLDARETPTAVRGAGQSMYASDSIGRMSTASSSYLGSEFGHGARALSASESGAGTSSLPRKNRKVAPPEVLVVVRPPPSKQGNPLNLQIQLVTPQAGGGSGGNTGARASADLSRDEIPASITNASVSSATSSNATSSAALKTPPATGSALRRSNSVGSSRSALSEASTAFSTGSASTSGSGRRVTPLYNLCFHSFLPTTVTDAGTDQKVAKFGKRGVEIDGFGQLTPHELLSGINDLASADRRRRSFLVGPSSTGNGGGFGRPGSASGASDLASHGGRSDGSAGRSTEAMLLPTTSISDIAGGGQARTATSDDGAKAIQEPPTSFDAMSPQAKDPARDLNGGGLGGKLLRSFKKFSVNAAANAPASSATASQKSMLSGRTGDTTETANANGGASGLLARVRGAASKVKEGSEGVAAGNGGNGSAIDDEDGMSLADSARHGLHASETDIPQLAIGAGLRSDGTRRAQGYYWVVRRWNRRLGDNVEDDIDRLVPGRQTHGANPILNSVWKRFNVVNRMGGQEMHPPSSQIAVRFEWTRSESRKKSVTSSGVGRHGRAATDAGGGGRSVRSQSSVRGSLDARTPGHEAATMAAPATVAAMSTAEEAAKRSSEALRPPTNGGSGSGSRPSSLFGAARGSMDRTSAVSAGEDDEASDPEDSETKWACHLVLGPTTRIPIGSLAPTPHHPKLVAQLTVPYPLPDLSQSGLGIDGAGLTREELKDIISVTALFVIVREAFGGLAKRRKGDSALKFGAAAAQR